MDLLESAVARVEPEHARALEWFASHEGDVGRRPWRQDGESVVPGVTVPLVAQRGIHKPDGWDLALSVTATKASVYLDGEPVAVDADTWVLPYKAHSGTDGEGLDSRWNQALFANAVERVPVGVFVPAVRGYRNLGLAIVESYDEATRTFLLRGPVRPGQSATLWEAPAESMEEDDLVFVAGEDASERALAWTRRRRDQDRFRESLLIAYSCKCCVTDCDAEAALQGAHILAYSGRSSQSSRNGLLLRADVHLLFDRNLLAIEPEKHTVRVAPRIQRTVYGDLDRRPIRPPLEDRHAPDPAKLEVRWAVFERAWAPPVRS